MDCIKAFAVGRLVNYHWLCEYAYSGSLDQTVLLDSQSSSFISPMHSPNSTITTYLGNTNNTKNTLSQQHQDDVTTGYRRQSKS